MEPWVWPTVVAVVIAVVSPAVAWLIQSRLFEAKTSEWRQSVTERLERIEMVQSQADLAAFRAMDNRREMDWINWRRDIEMRFEAHIKGQADWRHHEYAPEARRQSQAIATIQEQIVSLKDRMDRLERKVFNGARHD